MENYEPLRFDFVPDAYTAPGKVCVTIAPGRRGPSSDGKRTYARSTSRDYRDITRAGITTVVCLQEEREGAYVTAGRDFGRELDLSMISFPIRDGGVCDVLPLRRLVDFISQRVDQGETVLVHCAGGLGRSGLVVGCWLRSQGLGTEKTLQLLRDLRGPKCPENSAQIGVIRSFANSSERSQRAASRRKSPAVGP